MPPLQCDEEKGKEKKMIKNLDSKQTFNPNLGDVGGNFNLPSPVGFPSITQKK